MNAHGSPYAGIDTLVVLALGAAVLVAVWACWRWASELVAWWTA